MSLVVAMALSGLEADQWSDELRDMYEKGAQLVNNSCPLSTRFSTSSPSASSVASSYQSLESGISSLSPNSGEFFNQLTQSAFELAYPITKITGQKTVEEIERELTSKCSLKKDRTNSIDDLIKINFDQVPITIIYSNRNVLDLGDHIKNTCKFVQPAVIPTGVLNYFQNRSQISRLSGAEPPSCRLYTCSFSGCEFKEPHYY